MPPRLHNMADRLDKNESVNVPAPSNSFRRQVLCETRCHKAQSLGISLLPGGSSPVSGLVRPCYKRTNPTYRGLTNWDEPPSIIITMFPNINLSLMKVWGAPSKAKRRHWTLPNSKENGRSTCQGPWDIYKGKPGYQHLLHIAKMECSKQ